MKLLRSAFIALSLIFTFADVSHAEKSPWEIKYPFKTALVQYEVGGNEKGTETLYIRGSGTEQSHFRKSSGKVMFMSTSTDKITLTNPELVTEIDMEKKSGRKFINPTKFLIEEYNKLSAKEKETVQKNAVSMGTNLAQMMGAHVQKKAGEHLGYTCDVVTMMGIKSLVVADLGILMKTEGSMLGVDIKTVATKFEKNGSVPDSAFEVPAGVKVEYDKEADKGNREMAKNVMDMLKDPNASKNMEKSIDNAKRESAKEERKSKGKKPSGSSDEKPADESESKSASDGKEAKDSGDPMKKGIDAFKKLW